MPPTLRETAAAIGGLAILLALYPFILVAGMAIIGAVMQFVFDVEHTMGIRP